MTVLSEPKSSQRVQHIFLWYPATWASYWTFSSFCCLSFFFIFVPHLDHPWYKHKWKRILQTFTTFGGLSSKSAKMVSPNEPPHKYRRKMQKSMEIKERTCIICGKSFVPHTSSQVYCSTRCSTLGGERSERENRRYLTALAKTADASSKVKTSCSSPSLTRHVCHTFVSSTANIPIGGTKFYVRHLLHPLRHCFHTRSSQRETIIIPNLLIFKPKCLCAKSSLCSLAHSVASQHLLRARNPHPKKQTL